MAINVGRPTALHTVHTGAYCNENLGIRAQIDSSTQRGWHFEAGTDLINGIKI